MAQLTFTSRCPKNYKNRDIRAQLLSAVNGGESEINEMFETSKFGTAEPVMDKNPYNFTSKLSAPPIHVLNTLKDSYHEEDGTVIEVLEETYNGTIIKVCYFHLVKCDCGRYNIREDVGLYVAYVINNRPIGATVFLDGQDMGLCAEPCDDPVDM